LKKLSDYVIDVVANTGVRHIFMLTGGGCMHLTDSVGRNTQVEYICCLHEQACAFAAEAYAEHTNGLGVALVTTGPGGTNTVTGVAAAWLESASCLFISGQAKCADLIGSSGVRSMGQQEVDIVSIVRPITKYAKTILEPQSIRYELEKAVYMATHGRRGPVWIDIPLDVQAAAIDENNLPGFDPVSELPASEPHRLREQVSQAIDLLNRSERPVLFLGNGARSAHVRGLVDKLIKNLRIPVMVTWKIIDAIPEDCEFFAGRPGAVGQRGANFTQQNSDCMLIVGARLDRPQTAFSYQNFARAATKVLVDIDPAEIAKFDMRIDVPVCADAGDFIAEFLRQSDKLVKKDRSCWLKRTKEWQKKYPVVLPEYWDKADGVVSTYVLVDVLSEILNPDDLIVPGSSGPCSEVFMQTFRVKSGQRIVNSNSLGAMGTGLPASIGACLASGRKRTICVNGDGGFQLNVQELETVRRLNLPIKFFVLCNGGYASIMGTQQNYFQGRFTGSEPSSHLTLPDIIRVADAYGITTARLHNHSDIRNQVRAVLSAPGPMVCAVDVSPNERTLPRVTSTVRPDGSIVSKPMEDMSPFLSREEFLANMIVPPVEEQ
jgi:acetolactate synthase I/II/III large subunit